MSKTTSLLQQYQRVRKHSENICANLRTEDYVVQPIVDVSPPKWHLGHTTWFFETFILIPNYKGYTEFDSQYNFVFNSYYETVGARVIRTDRGNLSRPSVSDIYAYRKYVDEKMIRFLETVEMNSELVELIILGLNHEEQHQELLLTDIKYILGHNPLFPEFQFSFPSNQENVETVSIKTIPEGIYKIGFEEDGFCFDNECGKHKVYLEEYQINTSLVTNSEFQDFIADGGCGDFRHWHAEGWEWVKSRNATSPLYWHNFDGVWMNYTFDGIKKVDPTEAVCHVNFYEASAFATWKGMRLPTEAEWEVAADHITWGRRWEWTNSAYLPYPKFKRAAGAIGEYNGKFMVNQMVLRGGSVATPIGHSRKTYRNFFHAQHQWQFMGIRLAL